MNFETSRSQLTLVAGALGRFRYDAPWHPRQMRTGSGLASLSTLGDDIDHLRPDEVLLVMESPHVSMSHWLAGRASGTPLWMAATAWRDAVVAALTAVTSRTVAFTVVRGQTPESAQLPLAEGAQALADCPGACFLLNVLGWDLRAVMSCVPQAPPDQMPQTPVPTSSVMFLLGMPFVGSTALANALNAVYPRLAVGELIRLPQFRGSFPGPPWLEDYCLMCEGVDPPCPDYSGPMVAQLSALAVSEVFPALLARNGLGSLVEGSKDPNFMAMSLRLLPPRTRPQATVLVRRPAEAIASLMAMAEVYEYDIPKPSSGAQDWRDTYVNALRVASLESITLRVADYTTMERAGQLKFESQLLRSLGLRTPVADRGQAPSHQIGGNPRVAAGVRSRTEAHNQILTERRNEVLEAFLSTTAAADTAQLLAVPIL